MLLKLKQLSNYFVSMITPSLEID